MVFIWSKLVDGNANYTLLQVSINDLILIVAFPVITKLLLNAVGIKIPWSILIGSVILYIILPLTAAALIRYIFLKNNTEKITDNLFVILLISIPLIIQSVGIFAITYYLAFKLSIPYNVAAPAALIGTSNFFELAVAVAISLFGIDSGAALATVVGVLVEVPIMLMLVNYAKRTKYYFKGT